MCKFQLVQCANLNFKGENPRADGKETKKNPKASGAVQQT